MRTPDDPIQDEFKPLGHAVPKTSPAKPEPKPEGPSGIVIDENGRWSTTTHPKDPKP